MVINTNFNWSDSANEHRFLRNVLAHEHGHGLGISHVCPQNSSKLMEPFINLNFDGPQHDEIRAGQRGYGDPFEPDNSAAQATDLGPLLFGAPLSVGITSGGSFPFPEPGVELGSILSIDANGEQDYFRFHVDAAGPVSVVVTPIGNRYDSSLQACSGNLVSCCIGSFVDSDFIANLNMQIIDTNGSTVLATAADQPAGDSETLVAISLPSAGDYFIRVFEGNSPSQPQLYHLALTRGEAVCVLSGEPTVQVQFSAAGLAEPKNRVLPIKAGEEGVNQTIRVTWGDMPNWAGGHELLEGQKKWLLEPFRVCENSGDGQDTVPPDCGPAPGQPQKWFWAAGLTCDSAGAWFGDLAGLTDFCSGSGEACASDGDCAQGTCGVDGVIHIVDDGITPTKNENQQAIYTVQVVAEGCVLSDQASFSDPLVITQPLYGDLVATDPSCPMPPPNGIASLIPDVTTGLNKFSNGFCAAKKMRVDLEPSTLDFKVGIIDVLKALDAFSGGEYDLTAGTVCMAGAAGIVEEPRRNTR